MTASEILNLTGSIPDIIPHEPRFDITDSISGEGDQEIVLGVWDGTDNGFQPRGKQVREPKTIWYTAVTGIWQTVWLETVAARSIARLTMTPDIDNGVLRLEAEVRGGGAASLRAESRQLGTIIDRGRAPHTL